MFQEEIVEEEVVEVEETDTEIEPEVEEEVDWQARALKAESLLTDEKRAERKAKAQTKPTQATPTTDPIEAALRVNGMSKELLEQLKKVSQVTGKDLIDAQSDDLFIAIKEKSEKEVKREQASLPASRGAGAVKAKVSFNTPNLTKEQHKALIDARN